MEARNRPISDWFTRIRTGQIRLPRFQRFEAWSHSEVAGLLEAVLRGLPAGATLVLEIGDKEPFVSRSMIGAPEPTERVSEHLLDGQQRLTALWRSFHDLYDDRTYLVRIEPDDEHGGIPAPVVLGQARWWRNGKCYPLWVDSPVEVHQRGYIPFRLLRPADIAPEIKAWSTEATKGDLSEVLDLQEVVNDLRSRVGTYNIPYLSLPVTTPKDIALDVFIKMNTSSVRLSSFDIIVAQLEEAVGESLHDLIRSLRSQVPAAEAYRDVPNLVLDIAALREDRPPSQASYQRLDLARIDSEWERIVAGINWAVEVLEGEFVFDADRLPSIVVVPIVAALHDFVPAAMDGLGNARTLMRQYVWRAFLTSRYEQSAATRSLQDFRGLRGRLKKGSTDSPPIFDESQFPLPAVDDLRAAGWPKNKEILARGILALSLRTGGLDIADGSAVSRAKLPKREYHHIFPDSLLTSDGGLDTSDSYRALNCALITWNTNRNFGAKSPVRYLRERVERTALGEEEIRARLRSHLIPYEPLANAGYDEIEDKGVLRQQIMSDYEKFSIARAEKLAGPIRSLCDGKAPEQGWSN